MTAFLIAAEWPGALDSGALSAWEEAMNKIAQIYCASGDVRALGRGAWLIPTRNRLHALVGLASELAKAGIRHRMSLIEVVDDSCNDLLARG